MVQRMGFNPCRSPHQLRNETYMRREGVELPDKPVIRSPEVRKRLATMILAAALSAIQGLGYDVMAGDMLKVDEKDVELYARHSPELAKFVEESGKLMVTTTRALSMSGVPDIPVLAELDLGNPPNISRVLDYIREETQCTS